MLKTRQGKGDVYGEKENQDPMNRKLGTILPREFYRLICGPQSFVDETLQKKSVLGSHQLDGTLSLYEPPPIFKRQCNWDIHQLEDESQFQRWETHKCIRLRA